MFNWDSDISIVSDILGTSTSNDNIVARHQSTHPRLFEIVNAVVACSSSVHTWSTTYSCPSNASEH